MHTGSQEASIGFAYRLAAPRRSLALCSLVSLLSAVGLARCAVAYGQGQPHPTPLISPDAAYNQALRPVEITHRSIENWSNTETAALGVAVHEAAAACAARSPKDFAGEDLVALARLCALGQQWPAVLEAASRYVASIGSGSPPPQLSQAFAFQVQAALHLSDPDTALASSRAMLDRVPYDVYTQDTTDQAVHYLQLIRTSDALALLVLRQPHLLARLRAPVPPPLDLSVHDLFAAGLVLPALQQFANASSAAAQTVSALDAALPAVLSPDDSQPIALARRQYALLGRPLPPIAAAASLFSPTETPRINTSYGSSTVLVLFPDWCAQCIRMGRQFMPALYRLSERDVHLYGLLAEAKPPVTQAPGSPDTRGGRRASRDGHARSDSPAHKPAPADAPALADATPAADELLRGTPTLVVSPQLLDTFGATDFPLLAITDHAGIIRFLQTAPENAFVAGGLVDQVTARIAELWPVSKPAAASVPADPAVSR